MPIYRVQGPDGKVYRMEGPEGASEEQLVQAVRAHILSQPAPTPQTAPERTWGEAAGDVGAGLVSGLGSLVQLPGQLYGLATGDFSDTGALGLGKDIQEAGEAMKSKGLKAREEQRQTAVAEAEKSGQLNAFMTGLSETITDPALMSSFISEQLPNLLPMLLTGGATALVQGGRIAGQALAKGATKEAAALAGRQAATKAGATAALQTGAVQQGADVGAGAYDEIFNDLVAKGLSEEQAAAETINKARAAGVSGYALSVLANRFLPGGQALERVLAGQATGKGILMGAGAGALKEIPSEVTEEVGGRFAQNVAARSAGLERDLTSGLGETAAMSTLGAIGLGGVTGAVGGRGATTPPSATEAPKEDQRKNAPIEPEYAAKVKSDYDALVERERYLTEILRTKLDSTDLAGREEKKQASRALKELQQSPEYGKIVREYTRLRASGAYGGVGPVRQEGVPPTAAPGELEGFEQAPAATMLAGDEEADTVAQQYLSYVDELENAKATDKKRYDALKKAPDGARLASDFRRMLSRGLFNGYGEQYAQRIAQLDSLLVANQEQQQDAFLLRDLDTVQNRLQPERTQLVNERNALVKRAKVFETEGGFNLDAALSGNAKRELEYTKQQQQIPETLATLAKEREALQVKLQKMAGSPAFDPDQSAKLVKRIEAIDAEAQSLSQQKEAKGTQLGLGLGDVQPSATQREYTEREALLRKQAIEPTEVSNFIDAQTSFWDTYLNDDASVSTPWWQQAPTEEKPLDPNGALAKRLQELKGITPETETADFSQMNRQGAVNYAVNQNSNRRSDAFEQVLNLRDDMRGDVGIRNDVQSEFAKASGAFVDYAVSEVAARRAQKLGPALEQEAQQGLREQLSSLVAEAIQGDFENVGASLEALREQVEAVIDRYSTVLAEDIEAATPPAPAPARAAKEEKIALEELQDLAQSIKQYQQDLVEVSQDIKKAGNPSEPQKVADKKALQEIKRLIEDALRNALSRYREVWASGPEVDLSKYKTAGADIPGMTLESLRERFGQRTQLRNELVKTQREERARLEERGLLPDQASDLRMMSLLKQYNSTAYDKLDTLNRQLTDLTRDIASDARKIQRLERAQLPVETDLTAEQKQERLEMQDQLRVLNNAIATETDPKRLAQFNAAKAELEEKLSTPAKPAAKERDLGTLLPEQEEVQPVTNAQLFAARTELVAAENEVASARSDYSTFKEAIGPASKLEPSARAKFFSELGVTKLRSALSNVSQFTAITQLGMDAKRVVPVLEEAKIKLLNRLNRHIKVLEAFENRIGDQTLTPTEKKALKARAEKAMDAMRVTEHRISSIDNALAMFKQRKAYEAMAQVAKDMSAAAAETEIEARFEKRLDDALAAVKEKRAAIDALEKQARMFEQQEAAKSDTQYRGMLELQRMLTGDFTGVTTYTGAYFDKKRRNAVVRQISKVLGVTAAPKETKLAKLSGTLQAARNLLTQALKQTEQAFKEYRFIQQRFGGIQTDVTYTTSEALAKTKIGEERFESKHNKDFQEKGAFATVTGARTVVNPEVTDLESVTKALKTATDTLNDLLKVQEHVNTMTASFPYEAQEEMYAQRGLVDAEVKLLKKILSKTKADRDFVRSIEKAAAATQKEHAALLNDPKADPVYMQKLVNERVKQLEVLQKAFDDLVAQREAALKNAADARTELSKLNSSAKPDGRKVGAQLRKVTFNMNRAEFINTQLHHMQFTYQHAQYVLMNLVLDGVNLRVEELSRDLDTRVSDMKQVVNGLTGYVSNLKVTKQLQKRIQDLSAKMQKLEDGKKQRAETLEQETTRRVRAAQTQIEEAKKNLSKLSGVRYERDTMSLITKLQADALLKQIGALEKAIADAQRANDKTAEAKNRELLAEAITARDQLYGYSPVQATVLEGDKPLYQQTASLGLVRTTTEAIDFTQVLRNWQKEIEANTAQAEEKAAEKPVAPVTGERLPTRRKGPLVRSLRTGLQKVTQGGKPQLTAEGLSRRSANAVALVTMEAELIAAKRGSKKHTQLSEALDALYDTYDTEEIDALRKQGRLAVSADRVLDEAKATERLKEAKKQQILAKETLRKAKTVDAKALAEFDLEAADAKVAYYARKKADVKGIKVGAAEYVDAVVNAGSETDVLAADKAAGGIEYSVGTVGAGLTTADVNTELDQAMGEKGVVKGSNGKVRVYNTVADFVAENPEYAGKIRPDARAFVQDGKAVLFGENIGKGEALSVLLHEIGAHVGMRGTMPNAQYNALVQTVKGWAKRTDNSLEARIGRAAMQRVEAAQTPASQVNDELLAYAIEEAVLAGVNPDGVNQTVAQRFVRMVVNAFNKVLRTFGLKGKDVNAVELVNMAYGAAKLELRHNTAPISEKTGEILFSTKPSTKSKIVGSDPGVIAKVRANVFGLAGRVQYIDSMAALDETTRQAVTAGDLSNQQATQLNYNTRIMGMANQFVGLAATNGPIKHFKNKDGDYVFGSSAGVNLGDVAKALQGAKDVFPDTEVAFTVMLAGERAKKVGWEKLNYKDPAGAKAEYDAVMAKLASNEKAKKAFEEAERAWHGVNNGMLDFLVDSGAMTHELAAQLKNMRYVPYFRMNGEEVQLFTEMEKPISIGNIKDQPMLRELVGDDTTIQPFFTSAMKSIALMTRMGMRNVTIKDTAYTLKKLGMASAIRTGPKPAGPDYVAFKDKGLPMYVKIDSDLYGIPAELVVKGLEGIKTTLPAIVRLMGAPANLLRYTVTRMPTYAVRQIIRDPMSMFLTGNMNSVPVLSSMKQLMHMQAGRSPTEKTLMEAGVINSNVFTGDTRDLDVFMRQVVKGDSLWTSSLAKLDAFSLQGDAASRAVLWEESKKAGFSDIEASLRVLESMNFSRRGLSPSMLALNTMIPFFNAQVQGLDVLWRSATGKMPFAKRLDMQRKMLFRGALMMASALVYAAYMQDDDDYKKATPEERAMYWFVNVPGTDRPLRVPIPFEVGYVFKALPELAYNVLAGDTTSKQAVQALGAFVKSSTPNIIPQGAKPLIEVALNRSFFNGLDIESQAERKLTPEERIRQDTTELAKVLGKFGVLSPVQVEHLVYGFTGTMGVLFASLANPILRPFGSAEAPEGPAKDWTQHPLVKSMFQPEDGRGLLNAAFDVVEEAEQASGTYKQMLKAGRRADAQAFLQENLKAIQAAAPAGRFRQQMGEWASLKKQIAASARMTPDQKRDAIRRVIELQNRYAQALVASQR